MSLKKPTEFFGKNNNQKEEIASKYNPPITPLPLPWTKVEEPVVTEEPIAQEVEKVLPEIVKESNGKKTVNYNGLIGLFVEAIKDQQTQINSLKQEIENLKK